MSRGILSCAACARRAVRAFNAVQGPMAPTALPFRPSRSYAVEAGPKATLDAPRELEAVHPADSTVAKEAAKRRLKRAVNEHLDRMDDPWTIGKYVEKALARGAFEEALLLVEKASRNQQLVVSWNHLIDYQLTQDRIKDAIKLYNDMKKRRQPPNDRTYTILFRGLAKCSNKTLAVQQALKHYNLLLQEKEKGKEAAVQPSHFHLNAVLNVCARAGNIDALFTIANSINNSNLASTAYTYTIIFNALRHNTVKELEELSDESEKAAKRLELVNLARGLWVEVSNKWSKGKLVLDEDLVCSICRTLFMGPNDETKLEVLRIIEETMNVPNLVLNPQGLISDGQEKMKGIASGDKKPLRIPSSFVTYVIPGTNTLGLVLNVLDATRHTRYGIKYWNLFVRQYGLVPDENNCLGLFYMLRTGRASADAAALLEGTDVPEQYLRAQHYRLAMQACLRDNVNQGIMGNSEKIVNSMMRRFTVPDLEVLNLHLRVALFSSHWFRATARQGDVKSAHLAFGRQIQEALGHIWEPYRQAHYHYFHSGPRAANKKLQDKLFSDKTDVIFLARQMSSAFHKILREKLVKEEDVQAVEKTFAEINKDIQDFNDNHVPEGAKDQAQTSTLSALSAEGGPPGATFVWKTYVDPDARKGPAPRLPRQDQLEHGRPRREREPRDSAWKPRDSAWKPRDSAWKPRDSAWKPRDSTWKPRDPAWKPQDSAWKPRSTRDVRR